MTRIVYKRYKSRAFAKNAVRNILNRIPELKAEDFWITESIENENYIVMINTNKIDVLGFSK